MGKDIGVIEKEIKKIEGQIADVKKAVKTLENDIRTEENKLHSGNFEGMAILGERDTELAALRKLYNERVEILKKEIEGTYSDIKAELDIDTYKRDREKLQEEKQKEIKELEDRAEQYRNKPEFEEAYSKILEYSRNISNGIKKLDDLIEEKEAELRAYDALCRKEYEKRLQKMRANYEEKVKDVNSSYDQKIKDSFKTSIEKKKQNKADKEKEINKKQAELKELQKQFEEAKDKAATNQPATESVSQKTGDTKMPSFETFISAIKDKTRQANPNNVAEETVKIETVDNAGDTIKKPAEKKEPKVSVAIKPLNECEKQITTDFEKMVGDSDIKRIIFFNIRENDPGYDEDSARVFSMLNAERIESYSPDVMIAGLKEAQKLLENESVASKSVIVISGAEFLENYQGYDENDKSEITDLIKQICKGALADKIKLMIFAATDNNRISSILKEII